MEPLAAIGVLILVVFTIIGGLIGLSSLISRSRAYSDSSNKGLPYECGLVGDKTQTSRIPSGYYLTAILFVLFDIEIIFLYPWALAYRDFLGTTSSGPYLIAFIIFLALFVLGLFWEVRAKALRWK